MLRADVPVSSGVNVTNCQVPVAKNKLSIYSSSPLAQLAEQVACKHQYASPSPCTVSVIVVFVPTVTLVGETTETEGRTLSVSARTGTEVLAATSSEEIHNFTFAETAAAEPVFTIMVPLDVPE